MRKGRAAKSNIFNTKSKVFNTKSNIFTRAAALAERGPAGGSGPGAGGGGAGADDAETTRRHSLVPVPARTQRDPPGCAPAGKIDPISVRKMAEIDRK